MYKQHLHNFFAGIHTLCTLKTNGHVHKKLQLAHRSKRAVVLKVAQVRHIIAHLIKLHQNIFYNDLISFILGRKNNARKYHLMSLACCFACELSNDYWPYELTRTENLCRQFAFW